MAAPRSGELFFKKIPELFPKGLNWHSDVGAATRPDNPTSGRLGSPDPVRPDPNRIGRVGIWNLAFFSFFFRFFQSIFPKFFRQDFGCEGQSESPQKVEIRSAEGAAKNFFWLILRNFIFTRLQPDPTRQGPWLDPAAKNPTVATPTLMTEYLSRIYCNRRR